MNAPPRGLHQPLLTELADETADHLARRTKVLRGFLVGQSDLISLHARGLCEQKFRKSSICRCEEHLLKLPQHFRKTHDRILICTRTHGDIRVEDAAHNLRIRDKECGVLCCLDRDIT